MSNKISIITVNYNNAAGLLKTIESVLAQKGLSFEFIIVDGNSSDESLTHIQTHKAQITKYISEPDTGVYSAMNKGIAMATGSYLLFLNSGDHFYEENSIQQIEKYLTVEDIICFDIMLSGNGEDYIHIHPETITFSFLFEETLAHQAVFIKRELFDKVGYYDESLAITADWKFFIHAFTFHQSTYKTIHKTLSVFYFGGMSSTGKGSVLRKQERSKILNEEFSLFLEDYINLRKLKENRVTMLAEIEKTSLGKKFISLLFRIWIVLFSRKKLSEIIKK